jgi:hypothetical protein
MTDAMPYILEIMASSNGLFLISTILEMMIMAPQNTPAAPSPAMALPMMKAAELGAAAQRIEPPSKMIEEIKYTHLRLKKVYILPKVGWKDIWVRR